MQSCGQGFAAIATCKIKASPSSDLEELSAVAPSTCLSICTLAYIERGILSAELSKRECHLLSALLQALDFCCGFFPQTHQQERFFQIMIPECKRPVRNWLLDALPEADYDRLVADLNPVSFALGDVIYESGAQIDHVYFPTTLHVSLIYTMVNGVTAEMGLVGNEGVIGIALFMGGETTCSRAVIQGAGQALTLRAKPMQAEFDRGGDFQRLLLRYTQALITQISQTAVCNRLHSVEQRLCRWLLMTRDRTHTDELQMTQEFISNMLGVRREGVTHAARNLQDKGLISYLRGHIKIVDRPALETHTCECYAVVKAEHSRLTLLSMV